MWIGTLSKPFLVRSRDLGWKIKIIDKWLLSLLFRVQEHEGNEEGPNVHGTWSRCLGQCKGLDSVYLPNRLNLL